MPGTAQAQGTHREDWCPRPLRKLCPTWEADTDTDGVFGAALNAGPEGHRALGDWTGSPSGGGV